MSNIIIKTPHSLRVGAFSCKAESVLSGAFLLTNTSHEGSQTLPHCFSTMTRDTWKDVTRLTDDVTMFTSNEKMAQLLGNYGNSFKIIYSYNSVVDGSMVCQTMPQWQRHAFTPEPVPCTCAWKSDLERKNKVSKLKQMAKRIKPC